MFAVHDHGYARFSFRQALPDQVAEVGSLGHDRWERLGPLLQFPCRRQKRGTIRRKTG